ncbi:ankyrin repeat domain-containing protein [Myxococcus qinghaiensis]|uniref:ankyrin repeat domain-containing protein n=1 Tax=Myxococcus qinghaiensis TaxID=2906758 RepID=UPI0020A80235|nr:ankyrin repeat domain-containing protein [Myxococcus qinghaiensis]MCP3167813.1 ankyrin repeat domain-containing protein [Myxococcus qinghaiensis]
MGLRGVLGPLGIAVWVLLAPGGARALEPAPEGEVEESAVMKAISSGDAAGLTALLARGEPRNLPGTSPSTRNVSPLMRASELGREELVRMLLEAGADPTLSVPRHLEDWPLRGWTALCFAHAQGHSAIEQRLLRSGALAHPSCLEEADFAAAVHLKQSERVLKLARTMKGRVPPVLLERLGRFAHEQKAPQVMRALRDVGYRRKVVPPPSTGKSPDGEGRSPEAEDKRLLTRLIWEGTREEVRLALERGVDPDVFRPYDDPPLIAAAKKMDVPLLRLLLEEGAKVDITNSSGLPALDHVVSNSRDKGPAALEAARMLLEAGARSFSPAGKPPQGFRVLDAALSSCRLDLIDLLFEHGAKAVLAAGPANKLYETVVSPDSPCPEELSWTLLERLYSGGARMGLDVPVPPRLILIIREGHDAYRSYAYSSLWSYAAKRPPEWGRLLRQAGLPPEPDEKRR